MRFYLLPLLVFISLSAQGGKTWFDQDFAFEVVSSKLSYKISRKGRYLSFSYLGKDEGFYLKSCHKGLIKTLNREFNKIGTELLAVRKPSSKLKEKGADGILKINKEIYPYYRGPFVQPSLVGLEKRISFYIRGAQKQCSGK